MDYQTNDSHLDCRLCQIEEKLQQVLDGAAEQREMLEQTYNEARSLREEARWDWLKDLAIQVAWGLLLLSEHCLDGSLGY